MTILTELARLYDRLEKTGDAPPHGYSLENIGGEVVLDETGHVLAIRDLRVPDEKGRPTAPMRFSFVRRPCVLRKCLIAPLRRARCITARTDVVRALRLMTDCAN